ncbi:hypothetical protein AU375_04777 [Methylobacterium radiotolerans]|nr:hypothetical protein AU375_04777 [Methylobacterium radiotolerans]
MDDGYPVPPSPMSEERFLDWAEAQDGRFELVEGMVVMHAGATRDHERVAKRVFAALLLQCDESTYDVNKGEFGVRIKAGTGKGSIYYPDVVVDLQSGNGKERATNTPVVVVEVLSSSTGYDVHVEKFENYKMRDTLKQYVVLEQDEPKVYVWLKGKAGWPAEPEIIKGMDKSLEFPDIDASVELAEIYKSAEPKTGYAM